MFICAKKKRDMNTNSDKTMASACKKKRQGEGRRGGGAREELDTRRNLSRKCTEGHFSAMPTYDCPLEEKASMEAERNEIKQDVERLEKYHSQVLLRRLLEIYVRDTLEDEGPASIH